jgi:hypothetical protein
MPNQATRTGKPVERQSQFSTPVDAEALAFIQAIEDYKEEKGRPFPSWTEVLKILKSLGYEKRAGS